MHVLSLGASEAWESQNGRLKKAKKIRNIQEDRADFEQLQGVSRKIHKYSSVFIYVFFQILLLTISVTALYNNVQSLYKAYFAIRG